MIISDGRNHFYNKRQKALILKYGIIHRIVTACHSSTNDQTKKCNREIKRI